MKAFLKYAALALLLFSVGSRLAPASAQSYSVAWSKIAGGGGTSTGGTYSVSGTIGQPDAGVALTGGNYSVTGGFWALIQVVQTPEAPTLHISHSDNVVTVYWQAVTGWNLLQSGNLAAPIANWATNTSFVAVGGTNFLRVTNPVNNLFYRLNP